jgi:hypothetical protein
MSELAVLWGALFVTLVGSCALTLIGSWLVLWRYRRTVARAMSLSGFGPGAPASAGAAAAPTGPSIVSPSPVTTSAPVDPPRGSAEALLRRAVRAPGLETACLALAGLAYALVLAGAYLLATPAARTPTRFALTLWVDLWPLVLAAALTAPHFLRSAAVASALYFTPFVLGTIAVLAFPDAPADSVDAALLGLRDTVTPTIMVRFWVIFAGAPTAALLLFLNPRLRAVSPLLLAFTMVAIVGLMTAWIVTFASPIKDLIYRLAAATRGGWAGWLMLAGSLVLGIAAAAWAGWMVLRGIKQATLAKTISDRTLVVDALWLFFASYYAMQFVVQGRAWLLTGALAFAAYWIVLAAARARVRRRDPSLAPRGLTFLRVFALGPKSNALFDALAKHWRRVGSMQLITGPDLAQSTAQPHQLLDFVTGRLARHFIGDARTLETRLALLDRAPDRDGWYRINNFFCRADAWQAVLARLVQQGDVVLMDLRSFSAHNAGCVHELRHLVEFVPIGRCVFIVDSTTDIAYLRSVLRDAWAGLAATSPNREATAESVELHAYDSGRRAMRRLLQRLCHAA